MPFSSYLYYVIFHKRRLNVFMRFLDFRNKALLIFLIVGIEYVLFCFTRHIQNDMRLIQTNWFLDSLPSLNLAIGLPFILWLASSFSFLKSLTISLLVCFAHEIVRFFDDGIPVDPIDLLFTILGSFLSLVFYFILLRLFNYKISN